MDTKNKIRLDSQITANQYELHDEKICVFDSQHSLIKSIDLPKETETICFYDMYYETDKLKVVVATRGFYDKKYILDEIQMCLVEDGYTK